MGAHPVFPAGNHQGVSLDQGLGQLSSGLVIHRLDCGSGYPHLLGALALGVPQQVNEPTANIGLDLEQIEAQAKKQADEAKLTQAGAEPAHTPAELTQAESELTTAQLNLVAREGGAC